MRAMIALKYKCQLFEEQDKSSKLKRPYKTWSEINTPQNVLFGGKQKREKKITRILLIYRERYIRSVS